MTRIGLIALASDPTMEPEWRKLIPVDTDFYVSRIAYANSCTPESLSAMSAGIAGAAELLLPNLELDSIAFGCTSATIAIGETEVEKQVGSVRPGVPVATPITAALSACRRLGVGRLAVLAPYLMETAQSVAQWFEDRGMTVVDWKGLGLERDDEIAALEPADIFDACERLDVSKAGGLFLSCTALRAAPLIEELERRYGVPVLTSNQCLAWQALRLADNHTPIDGYGALMRN